jgi:hypothetical protein
VHFDPDHLDAAYAELDARYAAGEGRDYPHVLAQHRAWMDAFERRDFDGLAALYPAHGAVVHDHRKIGFGTLSASQYVELLRPLVELAPDVRLRIDHFEASAHGVLMIGAMVGTRDGGEFENPRIVVREFGSRGALVRIDHYDEDQLAEAEARFEAIRGVARRDPFAALVGVNAATATMDRLHVALAARDRAGALALAASPGVVEDLLRVVEATSGEVLFERRLVAGDRVCLDRITDGSEPRGCLWLAEVDGEGTLVSGARFELDAWRAAVREAWRRWLARDELAAGVMRPIAEFAEGVNDHDRARIRAVLADDMALDDHRRSGAGRLEGPEAYLDALGVSWEMVPDVAIELGPILALDRHGELGLVRHFGTGPAGGGPFEAYAVALTTVAQGRITGIELFDVEHLERAKARFEELQRS